MDDASSDVIDDLVGVTPGSLLDAIRAHRPAARENAQRSYLALFEPEHVGGVSLVERFAVAAFVARLHQRPETSRHYESELAVRDAGLARAIAAQAELAAATGPYGSFPAGPLSREDVAGPVFRVAATALDQRLAAALEHAHMLVFHPRDADPVALQALLNAGWSATDIVTLSQLVAFLAFQIRLVAGLRALAGAEA